MIATPQEHWIQAYREAPEIFEAFSRAEDPEGRVTQRLLSHLDPSGRRLLELGCGTGRYSRVLGPLADLYLAVEPSAPMAGLARKASRDLPHGPSFLLAKGQHLPIRSGTVDAMVAAWVVVNLRADIRKQVLREATRVLRPTGCGLWLIENHWESEFQRYRGRGEEDKARVKQLLDEERFQLVETVETELRFSSADEAERVLGYLCGETQRPN